MDLVTVQAALAELERKQKRINNKIAYRYRSITLAEEDIVALRRELEDLVDKHIELATKERELKGDE